MKFFIRSCVALLLLLLGLLQASFLFEKKRFNNSYIRILNYHNIEENETKKLIKHIKWINKYFDFISKQEFDNAVSGGGIKNNKKPFALLTFDDGLKGNYSPLLNILKEMNISAVFFVCPHLIGKEGYMSKEEIQECLDSGLVSIGSHTSTHKELRSGLTQEEYDYEIKESKIKLEKMFNIKIDSFCWPFGANDSYSTEAMKSIIEAGYEYVYCTYSSPITIPDSRKLIIPRTNIQLDWNKQNVYYQLSPLHDRKFIDKRTIIEKCYKNATNPSNIESCF